MATLMAGLLGALLIWNSAAAQAGDPKPSTAAVPQGSLLVLVQPLWSELSAFQRETLAPLEPSWNSLPLAKKRSWLALTEKDARHEPGRARQGAGPNPRMGGAVARTTAHGAKQLPAGQIPGP
jgi:hypothetical protein